MIPGEWFNGLYFRSVWCKTAKMSNQIHPSLHWSASPLYVCTIMVSRLEHPPKAPPWVKKVEPHFSCEEEEQLLPCYSKLHKADLLPGTFVVRYDDSDPTVARIVKPVNRCVQPFQEAEVNIFRQICKVGGPGEVILRPQGLGCNHLQHVPEIVQTSELRRILMVDVKNLAFVFTEEALNDGGNLLYMCQGMANAFVLRFMLLEGTANSHVTNSDEEEEHWTRMKHLVAIQNGNCLPFPSSYMNSKYYDCFPCRVWNNLIAAKLLMMKPMGRYSQQQGLYGRDCARMNFTAEAWGFLCLQFANLFAEPCDLQVSNRLRIHRLVESRLAAKAARI